MKKKIVSIAVIIIVLLVGVTSFTAWAASVKKQADVNATDFWEDNKKYYSNLQVKTVPTFETKDDREQEMVVVVDFGAWYEGGHVHLVSCVDGKDCTEPQGRTLQLLDKRNDAEATYYKEIFNK